MPFFVSVGFAIATTTARLESVREGACRSGEREGARSASTR
jgi:hypothetical protein